MKTMKILVTNDDGIYSKGLWSLVEELQRVGQVIVVAPDREQSGIGAAVTLHQPVRINKVQPLISGIEAYSVEGTPADSVILALGTVAKGIDLVIAGINEGSNLGDDILISGTVGAALQGYFRGFPAIALSLNAFEEPHFEAAAKLAALLASKISAGVLPSKLLLNINLPNLPPDRIQGIELTRLSQRCYVDSITEGYDGRRTYFWIMRGQPNWNSHQGTDIWAIEHQMISITPLHSDLTNLREPSPWQTFCFSLFAELCPLRGSSLCH